MDNMPTLAEYIAKQAGVPGASCPNLPNTYIGMRYVPEFADPVEWDATMQTEYEYLKIVTYQGNSYTSRTWVPKNIPITNTDYWILTGNYNAQVEAYRQEVLAFDGRITENTTSIVSLKSQWEESLKHTPTVNVKYPPAGYTAAVGDGTTDDTDAIRTLLTTFRNIYVPAGNYKITSEITADNIAIKAESGAWFTMHPSAVTDTLLNLGRTSYIQGLGLQFSELLPGVTRNQQVLLRTNGERWGLQRGSLIENCIFGLCGTSVEGNPFSIAMISCELKEFFWSAIDIGNGHQEGTTQNIFINLYVSHPNRTAIHAIRIENYSNNIFDCLNIEHGLFSGAAMYLENCTQTTIGSVHLEGIGITSNYNAMIQTVGGNLSIDSIVAIHTRNLPTVSGQSIVGLGSTRVPWGSWNYIIPTLVIKNFTAGGIAAPDPNLYPNEQEGRGLTNKEDFKFIYAINQTPLWKAKVESLCLWTYDSDTEIYRKFPTSYSIQWDYFPSMPRYGNTADRPNGEMIPPYSARYFDTQIQTELIWNGTSWIPVIPPAETPTTE